MSAAAKLQDLYYAASNRDDRDDEKEKCQEFWVNVQNPRDDGKVLNPFAKNRRFFAVKYTTHSQHLLAPVVTYLERTE